MDWSSKTAELLAANESNRKTVGLSQQTDLTPLQIASLYDAPLAEAMIEQGVSCDLHSASALGNRDIVNRLGNESSLAREVDLLPPLGFALLKGQVESIQALLANGDDPNRELKRIGFFVWEIELASLAHWRPIHMAATHGYVDTAADVVRLLVRHGARVNEPCMLGEGALHLAATYGWLPVMAALLESGANVDLPTVDIALAIHRAASPPKTELDLNITPLMVACREGRDEAVSLLLKAGANPNATSKLGRNALHFAADAWWRPNTNVVETLLVAGVDATLSDRCHNLPVHYAHKKKYKEVAEILAQSMN